MLVTSAASDCSQKEIVETDIVSVISEDITKRSEYEKHFLRSGGSYEAVIYQDAVHYFTNGKWYDYNNSLTLNNNRYTTKNSHFNVSFANNVTINDDLVIFKCNNKEISWKPINLKHKLIILF